MPIKQTIPTNSGDYLQFGNATTPVAAQVGGYEDSTGNGHLELYTTKTGTVTEQMRITQNGGIAFAGATNYGTSGQYLKSNGDAAPTWVTVPSSYVGPQGQVFTASGTLPIPTGITKVKATVVGAGGAGAGSAGCSFNSGGGGGGTAIVWLTGLTPGNTITVTRGAGNTSGTGGSSSISSGTQTITTATGSGGGLGTSGSGSGPGGAAGAGSGGTLNLTGTVGGAGTNAGGTVQSSGGPSFLGGGGNAFGAGVNGGGGGGGSGSGGNGVIIFEY